MSPSTVPLFQKSSVLQIPSPRGSRVASCSEGLSIEAYLHPREFLGDWDCSHVHPREFLGDWDCSHVHPREFLGDWDCSHVHPREFLGDSHNN